MALHTLGFRHWEGREGQSSCWKGSSNLLAGCPPCQFDPVNRFQVGNWMWNLFLLQSSCSIYPSTKQGSPLQDWDLLPILPPPVSYAPPLLQFDNLSIVWFWFWFLFPIRFGIISSCLFLSLFAGASSFSVLGYCPTLLTLGEQQRIQGGVRAELHSGLQTINSVRMDGESYTFVLPEKSEGGLKMKSEVKKRYFQTDILQDQNVEEDCS